MAKKKKYPWEVRSFSYREWGEMDFDWLNHHKVHNTVESYFFRYDNYYKGLKNHHIMRSVFGNKRIIDIQYEINDWFNKCIGAYTEIEYD